MHLHAHHHPQKPHERLPVGIFRSSQGSSIKCRHASSTALIFVSKRRRRSGHLSCKAVSDRQKAAERRLASLLDTSGNGEQELLDKVVAEESGESKFGGYLLWSFLVLGGCILICGWQNLDPYGGASWSLGSLRNGLIGVAVAVPVAVVKAFTWTPEYRNSDSDLKPIVEIQRTWLKLVHPVFGNLSSAQAWIIVLLECFTNSIFAFSLLEMTIFRILQWSQPYGKEIPESSLVNISLAMVAAMSGWVNMGYRSPPLDQLGVVEEASAAADRYYRFIAPVDGNSPEEMAITFKETCKRWYKERRMGMYIVGMSSTLEVFVCGCLWKWTGDLSAAIAACLVFNAPDYYFLGKSIKDPKTWM